MKFLDTNILAYAFYENAHTTSCQNAIMAGGCTNAFNLAEAFLIIEKETKSRETAQKAIRALLKSSLQIIDVDVNLIFEALKRSNLYRLSIFDLIHYTSASMNDCTTILSYDADFDDLEIPRQEP